MIHPSAVIDPDAIIAEGVDVGPFTTIGAGVVIEEGSWIGPHVVLNGPTHIGKENKIYQFSSIGDAPQHLGYRGEKTTLEIGDGNTIREYCTLNRGTTQGGGVTRIGSDNLIMAYCHIAHDCQVGDHTIFVNSASLAGHVEVGDYSILGGYTLVHQFCRLGAHSITAIGTATFKDIPPFFIAAGNAAQPRGVNVKGLRRRGFSEQAMAQIKKAYKLLYRSGLRLEQAVEAMQPLSLETPEVGQLIEFIQSSDRGVIR
ncbi:MAG: acyl-ACP--UDP-N-acetylglucosamine O-acyltransferase [Gammaproteobacteria bacterium]|nr:acyl-ACP--UDP-N-acetylglucosamine O-acyltransferase [Gammaproteobacteria bacterium]